MSALLFLCKMLCVKDSSGDTVVLSHFATLSQCKLSLIMLDTRAVVVPRALKYGCMFLCRRKNPPGHHLFYSCSALVWKICLVSERL